MTRNGTHPGETLAAALALAGGADRYEVCFRLGDLPDIRRIAHAYGAGAGLGGARLTDFVLAVSECGASALCRGAGRAGLRLWASGGHLFCEVRGGRLLLPPRRPAVLPPGDAESLRLWVLQRVCDDVAVSVAPDGATLVVSLAVR